MIHVSLIDESINRSTNLQRPCPIALDQSPLERRLIERPTTRGRSSLPSLPGYGAGVTPYWKPM